MSDGRLAEGPDMILSSRVRVGSMAICMDLETSFLKGLSDEDFKEADTVPFFPVSLGCVSLEGEGTVSSLSRSEVNR